MKIINVIPETYQEYEDHLSIVLFCFGCNLHCSYCYSYDFISDQKNILEETAEQLIDKHYHPLIDGLVFLGGEATLYPERMKEIALYAKEKYNLDTKLFTNGTNPGVVLQGLKEGWLDFVSIDFKTITDNDLFISGSNPHKYVRRLLEIISYENMQEKVEVRTTRYIEDQDLKNIIKFCEKLHIPHFVQQRF